MITDIEWVSNEGHPELHFTWDGEPAIVGLYQNQGLLRDGYISLLPNDVWGERLPEIVLPADKSIRRGRTVLRGFTRNREVVRLAIEFAEACRDGRFVPGKRE